ncbi:MAG: TldD/PmbA family protein, partial [Myxococcales bacterium]
ADPSPAVIGAMVDELGRNAERLKLGDYEKPYFIAYAYTVHETDLLLARFGSVHRESSSRDGELYVEVRVGDYAFDNTGELDSFFPFQLDEGLPLGQDAPADDSLSALKAALWLRTDAQYKQALADYHRKKGKAVYQSPEADVASFSREKPVQWRGVPARLNYDASAWKKRLLELSARFATHPEIANYLIQLRATRDTRYFVNTEGTRVADERTLYALSIDAETHAADEMVLTSNRAFYAPTEKTLPAWETIAAETQGMIDELLALRGAPLLDPYTGPAILSPQAAGVLFHEAVGHRLEGERQNSDEEGRTFKGQVGQMILPEFLDLIDDPTETSFEGEPLNGHYLYDDEGAPARRTLLVEGGVLKNYLMSRTPVEGFALSTGHGRAAGARKPMARMGVTRLVSHKSAPHDELKAKLIDLVVAQKKPYGLIVEDMDGGSTNTSSYGYQAFKGVPRVVRRVFPDGREELVRGVELVGTPLASINKIALTGDRYEAFNGFCGAESGYVPVSTIAPALLLEELELQRKKEEKSRPPILPPPGQEKK